MTLVKSDDGMALVEEDAIEYLSVINGVEETILDIALKYNVVLLNTPIIIKNHSNVMSYLKMGIDLLEHTQEDVDKLNNYKIAYDKLTEIESLPGYDNHLNTYVKIKKDEKMEKDNVSERSDLKHFLIEAYKNINDSIKRIVDKIRYFRKKG